MQDHIIIPCILIFTALFHKLVYTRLLIRIYRTKEWLLCLTLNVMAHLCLTTFVSRDILRTQQLQNILMNILGNSSMRSSPKIYMDSKDMIFSPFCAHLCKIYLALWNLNKGQYHSRSFLPWFHLHSMNILAVNLVFILCHKSSDGCFSWLIIQWCWNVMDWRFCNDLLWVWWSIL